MYKTLKNQQLLTTGLGPFTGGLSFLTKPFISNKLKNVEAALAQSNLGTDWKNNEAIKAIDDMTFMDKVNSAFSSLMESFTTDKDDYQAKFDTANHPLGGNKTSMGSTGMLSAAEQQAFDNAVSSGNVNVANHYAIINHHRALREEQGNLLPGDLVNLPHLADKEKPSSGSDNDNAPSHAEIIAAANLDKANTEAKITANEILKETGGLQSTSGQTAGAGIGSGVGGSDYAGAMRKGGLTSKKK